MARPLPNKSSSTSSTAVNTNNNAPIWGVDSNTQGGGVWAQTSAKRDKLSELLTELRDSSGIDTGLKGMETLDFAAVGDEKLDLELVDGMKLLVRAVDSCSGDGIVVGDALDNSKNAADVSYYQNDVIDTNVEIAAKNAIKQLFKLLDNNSTKASAMAAPDEEWTKAKFEATMNEAIRILSEGCLPKRSVLLANNKNPVAGSLDMSHPFCYLRQFVVSENDVDENGKNNANNNVIDQLDPKTRQHIETLNDITNHAFLSSTQLYRTLLLRATAQTLSENWDQLTTVTSGDIDRAAVSNDTSSSQSSSSSSHHRSTINSKSIYDVFEAYATKSPNEWVQSWWKLIDADADGLIDQEEMNTCVNLTIQPVHLALRDVLDLALEVCPVRTIGLGGEEEARKKNAWFLMTVGNADDDIAGITHSSSTVIPSTQHHQKLSWRNRRKELKARKVLSKTFQSTIARHFRDQVELPHRLRCIYAWAEKSHQDNKLDSILVDASGDWGDGAASAVMGRKRYVELEPKISYAEFREVQQRHLPHLDKIGEEIVMSFKEDIWLLQGKKRQNKELRRDCFLFLLGVSLIDVGIGMA
jgi:hypothetical protein